jgi:[ribosomal protein S5]-alanine N-acetyltransferase
MMNVMFQDDFMEFPELATTRLILTKITASDCESLHNLFSNPEVVKFYDLEPFTDSSQAEKLIALFESRYDSNSGIRWAIRTKTSGELIGTCGFNSWSEKMRNATIGYDLKPDYWNKGISTEALSEILRAAFAGMLPCGPLHRIQADTIPGNIASEKVLKKLGFKEEGIRREAAYVKGKYHDMKCFGILRPEFRKT